MLHWQLAEIKSDVFPKYSIMCQQRLSVKHFSLVSVAFNLKLLNVMSHWVCNVLFICQSRFSRFWICVPFNNTWYLPHLPVTSAVSGSTRPLPRSQPMRGQEGRQSGATASPKPQASKTSECAVHLSALSWCVWQSVTCVCVCCADCVWRRCRWTASAAAEKLCTACLTATGTWRCRIYCSAPWTTYWPRSFTRPRARKTTWPTPSSSCRGNAEDWYRKTFDAC